LVVLAFFSYSSICIQKPTLPRTRTCKQRWPMLMACWREFKALARLCLQHPLVALQSSKDNIQLPKMSSWKPDDPILGARVLETWACWSSHQVALWPLSAAAALPSHTHVLSSTSTHTPPCLSRLTPLPITAMRRVLLVCLGGLVGASSYFLPFSFNQVSERGETTGWPGGASCSCWFVFISSRPPPLLFVVQRQWPCAENF